MDPVLRALTTQELTDGEWIRLRAMLDVAFAGYFNDDDWDHAIGGTHVIVEVDHIIVAHASVVARRLEVPDRALHTGYVEAVATHPSFQGRGYASAVMQRAGDLVRESYELGALSTAIPAFYEQFGWERWQGPTYCRLPDELVRTEDDDGGVLVLRTPRTGAIDLAAAIACDYRGGDVW